MWQGQVKSVRAFIICGLLIVGAFITAGLYVRHKTVTIVVAECQDKKTPIEIPYIDAFFLDFFFRELILRDSLGYTLIGEKPMSFGGFSDPKRTFFPFITDYCMVRGWKLWEKYKQYFLNPRYKFWMEESTWTERVKFIILIDKHQISEVFENNIQDFKLLLGADISTNHLLEQSQNKPLLKNILNNQEALIGILLGYGRDNAWWYHNRDKSLKNPSVWGRECQNKFKLPWKKYQIEELALPGFVGDPDSSETILLKQRYLNARKRLLDYYKNKNFLEATLNLFKNGPDSV